MTGTWSPVTWRPQATIQVTTPRHPPSKQQPKEIQACKYPSPESVIITLNYIYKRPYSPFHVTKYSPVLINRIPPPVFLAVPYSPAHQPPAFPHLIGSFSWNTPAKELLPTKVNMLQLHLNEKLAPPSRPLSFQNQSRAPHFLSRPQTAFSERAQEISFKLTEFLINVCISKQHN